MFIIKMGLFSSQKSIVDNKIVPLNIFVLIKAVFLGILITESWYFGTIVADNFFLLSSAGQQEWFSFWPGILILLFFLSLILIYLYLRGFFNNVQKLLKSRRIDILVAFLLGIWIDVISGSFFSKFYLQFISSFNLQQLTTLIILPFFLVLLIIWRTILQRNKDAPSLFISDHELKQSEDDLLNFNEKVSAFAESVFNNGSTESFVFGVDAPWGIGKSTFVNFCQRYWEKNYKGKVLVYKFSPIKYSTGANLLEVFIDGLIASLQNDVFAPEIRPVFSRYSRLLRHVSRLSILGINVPDFSADYTVEEALKDLEVVLQRFKKKVIIVIDDLDRIGFSEIKNVLFVIRKSFVLPNISYVLCYDTENIGALEVDSPNIEKVSEFLEKFVNLKVSLYLDKQDLIKYVSENIEKVIVDKPVDPLLVRQAIGGLLDIYQSPDYHKYLPFIGDVRKLKRLINTVVLFKLYGTNFKNTDFDKWDLIHLLLIYIHYPNIFRKIYDTETNGGYGFFSAISPYDDGYPEDKNSTQSYTSDSSYKNSDNYRKYIKCLSEEQRFILEQVFNVNERLRVTGISSSPAYQNRSYSIGEVPEELKTSLACFNGDRFTGTGRNLEAYLQLIVNLAEPQDESQYKFYTNLKDKVVDGSMSIKDVFQKKHFSPEKGEQTHEKLWRILINNARKLNSSTGASLIKYLTENIPKYSLLEIKDIGIGLRDDLNYFLVRLLNDAGWVDKAERHARNTEENIKEIAEWIFGEGRHAEESILDRLSKPAKGILGLYDLILFRLFCNSDRGGDIFELSRALSKHGDKDAPTTGDTRIIVREEMREISQEVFHIFKSQYIDKNVNIFYKMENLTPKDLTGEYQEYIQEKVNAEVISEARLNQQVKTTKSRIISFIVYQLGNDVISHGIGCGFYDPIGKDDKHSIKSLVNDYLFDICFNPGRDKKNFKYLLDYLLRNYTRVFTLESEDRSKYVPRVEEFIKVLDKSKLADFWKTHRNEIKELKFEKENKTIFVGSYTASYKQDLPQLYKILDEYLEKLEQEKLSKNTIAGVN